MPTNASSSSPERPRRVRINRLKERLKHGWMALDSRILRRKSPHAILSWRYFLPRQSPHVLLHRKVFLRAWPEYPRPVWALIALYSYPPWYLFHGWRQVLTIWRRRSPELSGRHGISRGRQLLDLLVLALGHSTPPAFYYQYKLYRVPESQWLGFIYTHELPHWHRVMSPELGRKTSHLMSHKHAFAGEMTRLGLPAVESASSVQKGGSIPDGLLFSRQALFLKPESGSRKEGCFELHYDSSGQTYRLEGSDRIEGKEAILRRLEQEISRRDFLVQPLLRNHPLLVRHCKTRRLVTIRLVTIAGVSRGRMICANLEIPVDEGWNRVCSLSIDARTGSLSRFDKGGLETREDIRGMLGLLEGFRLPLWREVVQVAEMAHASFPDLSTIGWDLAITDQGVRLLEGNINWGVAAHQLSNGPLIPRWKAVAGEI